MPLDVPDYPRKYPDVPTLHAIDFPSRPRLQVDPAMRAAALLEKPATRGDLQAATDRIIKWIMVTVSMWAAVAIAIIVSFVIR